MLEKGQFQLNTVGTLVKLIYAFLWQVHLSPEFPLLTAHISLVLKKQEFAWLSTFLFICSTDIFICPVATKLRCFPQEYALTDADIFLDPEVNQLGYTFMVSVNKVCRSLCFHQGTVYFVILQNP